MFNIPFVFFVFSNLSDYKSPGYYLGNPIAYKWNTIIIPVGLLFCFIISLFVFFSIFMLALWKWKKTASL